MPKKKNDDSTMVVLDPYEESEERPVATRSPEETAAAEGRFGGDQIADYHKTHPTLDTSGPEHDPVFQAELRAEGLKKLAQAGKELAANDPARYDPEADTE